MAALPVSMFLLLADGFDGHHNWDGGWWIVMGLGMVVFSALVIGGAIWLIRSLSVGDRGTSAPSSPTPLEILERRLASGEVDVEEYQRRRAALKARDELDGESGRGGSH